MAIHFRMGDRAEEADVIGNTEAVCQLLRALQCFACTYYHEIQVDIPRAAIDRTLESFDRENETLSSKDVTEPKKAHCAASRPVDRGGEATKPTRTLTRSSQLRYIDVEG
jgi:hypothetical protein